MHEYRLADFAEMLVAAIRAHAELRTGDNLKQTFKDGSIREVCTDKFLESLALVIDGLLIMCRNFDCDPALVCQMDSFKNDLGTLTDKREGLIAARLEPIIEGIKENLNSRKFMFIPREQAQYYHCPLMFGPNFLVMFPKSAVFEMSEAGRCYACGLWTACVFHCMRVTEYGLRRLFKIAGAKLPLRGVKNPKPKQVRYPIEYADWNTVITQVKNKITKLRSLPTGPKKERRLQFLSDLADQCEYMKDIWRNELSHTRRIYSKEESLAVILRVEAFIGLLTSGPPK